jgi:hypothetical protein
VNCEGPYRTRRRLVRNGRSLSAQLKKTAPTLSCADVPSLSLPSSALHSPCAARWRRLAAELAGSDVELTLPGDIIEHESSAEQVTARPGTLTDSFV